MFIYCKKGIKERLHLPTPDLVFAMYEMILHVDLSKCWIGKLKDRFPVEVTLLDTIPMENKDQGVQDLVDIDLNSIEPDEIESFVHEMEGIDFVSVSRNEGTKVKMIVGTSSCLGCRALAQAEAFLLSAKVMENGWVEWRVVHDERESLDHLIDRLENAGMGTRIIEIKDYKDQLSLTEDQERVLRTALDSGYYDFPKRAGVRELARKLNVSTAYISYTLRSAQKKTIQLYFRR
jgi:hypothetical protein